MANELFGWEFFWQNKSENDHDPGADCLEHYFIDLFVPWQKMKDHACRLNQINQGSDHNKKKPPD
jgi:hypothetical protein